jgi:hypothetical protein
MKYLILFAICLLSACSGLQLQWSASFATQDLATALQKQQQGQLLVPPPATAMIIAPLAPTPPVVVPPAAVPEAPPVPVTK